jgi:hypothetical protein
LAITEGHIDREFVVTFPGFDSIRIRPLDIEQDAADIHDWVNRDYAKFWGMQGSTLEQVRRRYSPEGLHGEKAYIGVLQSTGRKVIMFLTFWAKDDPFGRHFDVREGDIGVHTFVAPGSDRIKDITYYIMKSMQYHMFSIPRTTRIVGEPDIRNEKVLVRLLQVGYLLGQALYLPHKTARFIHLTRERFDSLDHDHPPPRIAVPASWARAVRWHMFAGRVMRKLRLVPSGD